MNRHIVVAFSLSMLAAPLALGQSLSDRVEQLRRNRVAEQNRDETRATMFGALVYTDVSVAFGETPARDAIRRIAEVAGVNIIVRYLDDRAGTGIDPDQPISLSVDGVPALSVLEMILDQCSSDMNECTWQLRDGFVEVGPKEQLGAKSAQELRYYPVRDLLFDPPRFNNAPELDLEQALNQTSNPGGGRNAGGGSSGGAIIGTPGEDPEREAEQDAGERLAALIRELVEPDAWDRHGGTWASVRYHQGVLIVRAPDFVQRQISGYPFAVHPPETDSIAGSNGPVAPSAPRSVTFAGSRSTIRFEIEERGNVYAAPESPD